MNIIKEELQKVTIPNENKIEKNRKKNNDTRF